MLQFKKTKETKSCIPVKSVIELVETLSEVTFSILAVNTFPFFPSVSMPKAIIYPQILNLELKWSRHNLNYNLL